MALFRADIGVADDDAVTAAALCHKMLIRGRSWAAASVTEPTCCATARRRQPTAVVDQRRAGAERQGTVSLCLPRIDAGWRLRARYFFTSGQAGSGGGNAFSPGMVARIL